METIELVHTEDSTDLTALSDAAIESLFAEAGLEVEVMAHCNDVACPSCFAPARPAQAA